jgi:Tfp pilus assembly protein PilF
MLCFVFAGCESESDARYKRRIEQAVSEREQREAPPAPDLPKDQAAEVCASTARELEAKGFDKEAVTQYERVLEYNPSYPGVYHRLAILYDRQNRPMAALASYNKAVQRNPTDPELLADMGYFYMNGNQWPLAEVKLKKAVQLNPELKRGWNNLGITLAQQGKIPESIEAFKHAVSPAAAQSNVGIILARRGNYDQAREHLNEALKLDPNLAQARMTLGWVNERQAAAHKPTPKP